MKKITLLTLFLVCAISFGQNSRVSEMGENNPVYANQNVPTEAQIIQRGSVESNLLSSDYVSDPTYAGTSLNKKFSQATLDERNAAPNQMSSAATGANNASYVGTTLNQKISQATLDSRRAVPNTLSSAAMADGVNFPLYVTPRKVAKQEINKVVALPFETEREIMANGIARANQPEYVMKNSSAGGDKSVMADIIPTAGATETFTPDVGDNFFDPGGPGGSSTGGTAGNYPNCACTTLTTLAGVTEILFNDFSVFATFDWLKIYDGADTTGAVLFDNSTGGANQGDITLADMIASNGSATFVGASGDMTFEFFATGVVDYGGWDSTITVASGGGGGGGGGGTACTTEGLSNAFENGKSFTQNLARIVAHDVTVDADGDFMLESVNLNAFIGATGSGVNAAFVDIYVWGDNGGAPDAGNLITSELGFVPTSQTVVGGNFGFDLWDVELDLTDVMLAGQAGVETTYWVGVSLEPTDGSNTFWENSTAGLTGLGEAYDDGLGGGFVIDNTLEGVYTIFRRVYYCRWWWRNKWTLFY